jgi:protein tyrosine phosphatase (PTP) superfamily phosphohydrolase (DUF442 family)
MPNWVIEGLIATSPRPGYTPGSEHRVPEETVEEWLSDVLDFGISSVICLLAGDQLWLYQKSLPQGLLDRYREAGLEVAHVPTLDQLTHPFTPEQYEEAWRAFQLLPKPVLVHCSAGHDRTGRIVSHILGRLGSD